MLVGAYLWATSMSKRMKRFSLSRAKSSTVSFDQTHHIGADSKPLYPETFRNVLSFHKPLDLAAVISENGDAFHIRLNGKEAYSPKFKLTFGMYEGRAAVCDFTNQWFHIDQFGQKTYSQTFAWCGNFSKLSFEINGSTGQAPVRNRDSGTYSHIDQDGKILGGPYLYTGDINTQNQFVAWNMSNQVMICNFDGSPWSDKLFSMNLFDARTPHKGIAAVKDEKGWFYINRHGEESSGGARYAEVESHYNGQARVKSLDGTWLLIDESGQLIANFGQPQREMEQDLIKTSQNYWSALGLKSILDNKIIDRLSGKDVKSQIDDKLHKVLLNVSVDMGLCTEVVNEESGNSNYEITKKGMLLSSDCIDTTTKDKCTYWLQNRYFKHWLPSDYFKSLTRSPQPDTFLDISTDKSAVSLSQKVLASYSKDDWKGITTALSISDLINEHAMKQHQSDKRKSEVRRIEDEDFILADLGGGTGSLVSEIASNLVNPIPSVNLKFMCIDRPEVIDLVHKSSSIATLKSSIHFVAGDLFNNVLPSANVYLLSRVLHDWDDERASEILSRIRLYSPEDTTLFVIDRHSSKMNRHSLLSLHMYNIQRSHERTSTEWQELFYNSGWKSVKQSHFNGHEILTLKIDSTFLKTDGNNSISSHNNINQSGTSMTKKRDGEMRVVATSALPTVEAGVLSGSRVRKAVIPIAGLGTRMLPQSIVTPKAFLPIITKSNGIVSADPALSHLLSQILSENTGISEICIVASPDQESVLLKYLQSIKIIYPNAVFHTVLQSVPLGFGDAILCAKDFVQKEAFLVALGDHVFTPGSIQQVLESYQSLLHQLKAGNVDKNNQILSSVGLTGACLCSESEIPQTGLLLLTPINSSGNDSYNDVIIYTPTISESSGRSINESKSSSVKGTDTGTEMKHYGSGITSITGSGGSLEYGKVKRVAQMAEKPVHYDEFTVQDNFTGKSTYHAQLGLDVLPPSIFTELERLKSLQSTHGGEVDLRAAMKQHLQQQGRLYSCLIDGTRHDIGTPYVYWKTLQAIYDSNYDINCHKGKSNFVSSLSGWKNSKTFQGQKRNFNNIASDQCSASYSDANATSKYSIRSKMDTSCTIPHPLEPEELVARALLQWLQNIESSSTSASTTPIRTDTAATTTVTAGTVGVRSYSSHAGESIGDLHSLSHKSNEGPIHIASSPGRIDILGGFADYHGSHLLQHSTSQRCYAFARFTNSHNDILMQTIQVPSIQEVLSQGNNKLQDLVMYKKTIPLSGLFSGTNQTQKSSQMNLISKSELRHFLEGEMSDFIPKHEQLWPSYLVGVVHALLQHAKIVDLNALQSVDRQIASLKVDDASSVPPLTAAAAAAAVKHLNNHSGIEIRIVSDVPWNSGLASSAAVEMSAAMAISRVMGFNSSTMSSNEMALMCQAVENEVVGAKCGLMDQLTVANLPNHHSDQHVLQQGSGYGHLQQLKDGQMHEMQHTHVGEMQGLRSIETEIHEKRHSNGQTESSSILSLCCKMPLTVPPCVSFSLPSDMSVIAMESGVLRSVADAPYRQVRVASMMGMTIINCIRASPLSDGSPVSHLKYLCDLSLEEFNTEYRNLLPDVMTGREFVTKYGREKGTMKEFSSGDIDLDYNYRILSSTSHPIEENNRVLQFESLLRNYTPNKNNGENKNESRNVDEVLGNLMAQSHKSYSDCGLGTAQTDRLVGLLLNKNHGIIGAKISGGGGGGSISVLIKNMKDSTLNASQPQPSTDILCESDSATHQSPWMRDITPKTAAFLNNVKERYYKETGLHCTIRTGRSGPLQYHGFSSRSYSASSMSSNSGSSIGIDDVGRKVIGRNDSDSNITSTTILNSTGTNDSSGNSSNINIGNHDDNNNKRKSADITTNCTSNNYNTKTAAISNVYRENMSGIPDSPKSRILIVNHGYPPAFNGGSEVYTQTLALHLLESQEFSAVSVMAREHDPFREDYEMRATVDESNPRLPVYLLNYPREAAYYQFLSTSIDNSFRTLLQQLQPNIVHFHHLNHLSLNLPKIAKEEFNAKVVYTLHDYWLMCPRGQFLVTGTTSKDRREPWQQCSGQNDRKCAVDCYTNRYSGGDVTSEENDLVYWTDWIKRRMAAVREACTYVDAFIAPSKYLEKKFVDQFSIPDHKMVYHPYGFDRNRLVGRKREHKDARINNASMHGTSINATDGPASNHQCLSIGINEIATTAASPDSLIKDGGIEVPSSPYPYVFAYIGRHQPSKGINLLVDAALHIINEHPALLGKFIVKIYGRADMNATSSLKRKIIEALPDGLDSQVFQWKKEYNNFDIVREVFNEVDVIVVPSIWEENSPLVIHESQQCGVPVITADYGGMGELVKNNVNGLTFEFRNSKSLAAAMLQALNEPEALIELSKRGYIGSANGEIPCVEEHGKEMIELYSRVLNPIRATHEVEMNGVSGSERKGTKNKTQTLNYETAKFISNSSKEEEVQSDAEIDTDTGGDPRVPIPIIPFPSPWRVTFDTNPDDCNFSCTMCEQHSPYSPHQKERKAQNKRRRRMSFEVIESTVDQLSPKGLREIIPTTMGEPLQYKEFPNILKLCEKQNIKLNLTTNGSFFGRGVVEWAKLIVPVTVDVKISWNGATEETQQKIMKNSKLSKQVESLKEFVKERDNIAAAGGNYCSVTLQLTFMEDNLEEIPDIVAFAIANNCDRVKGHHLWAHFEEIKNQNLRRSTDSILRWNIIAKKCREYAAANPLKNKKILRLDNFFDLESSAAADPLKPQLSSPIHPEAVCPFLGKEAWVNHEGRFDPCCAPDDQRKVLGFFGNINEPGQSIEEIWKSEKYLDLVENYHKKPLCRGCNMRQPPR